MMRISSFKAVQHLYSFCVLLVSRKFRWADFSFPSTLQLSSFLEILMEPISQSESTEKIQLGLQEALVNAVLHGNSGDPSKHLRVRRILTPNWFVWQIQDEGKGIPIDERCASLPTDLDANHGRGLFIIHHCFDDVRWSRRGNRLQLATRR
ncbi:ATP-binding protein [Prochlorococcus sp. MIT 1307]|uniref:ATP-binding protein n=1 Tax=Prochlorococcus sp. MIT 1307 TaxID=3096219 RepID=UPI002A75017C|nr:ATP-binding protein [Prochlorococcus sp. MIT 1307]